MPYIDPKNRPRLIAGAAPLCVGDLNFAITHTICKYMEIAGLTYRTINDILGALEGAKQEFYRRVAVPYENGKLAVNGDVYRFCDPKPIQEQQPHEYSPL